jgi:hypothetical protein
MKKTALALLLALGIVGCNTTTTTVEADVQTAAANLCGFVPELASIAAIITAAYGGAATEAQVSTIAANVCKVVTPTTSTPAAEQWIYPDTNVVIHGKFVAKGHKA